jgi:aminoglycoside phosphotransferase (APT) family kinase protein
MKIARRQGAEPLGLYFHGRLRKAGLPVPALIAYGESTLKGRQSTIWEHVEGEQARWPGTGPCPYDEAECAELLLQIHALDFDGPFCLLGDEPPDREFGPASDAWAEMFPCGRAARSYFDQGLIDKKEADILASLPSLLNEELGRVERRLLHMDFFFNGNLILDEGTKRIIGVVDYAEAMAGDPLLEVAVFERHHLPDKHIFDIKRFRDAYGSYDPDGPLVRFYVLSLLLFERLMYDYVNYNLESTTLGKKTKLFLDQVRYLVHSFG